MEAIVGISLAAWTALYFIEASARKRSRFSRYAWLARGLRYLIVGSGIGAFLIVAGTDWKKPAYEVPIGIVCILLGVGAVVRCVVKRREIQRGLESGKIEPIQEGSWSLRKQKEER